MKINVDEVMVGDTLSVGRVKEFNSKDWFYKILKENPNIAGIYQASRTISCGGPSITISTLTPTLSIVLRI